VGAKCCSGQTTCKVTNDFYSQCVATTDPDVTSILGRDEQLGQEPSADRPNVSRMTLTFLPVARGVLCATLMFVVLAVRRRLRGNQGNRGSPEDGSPMLPSMRDVVEVEVA